MGMEPLAVVVLGYLSQEAVNMLHRVSTLHVFGTKIGKITGTMTLTGTFFREKSKKASIIREKAKQPDAHRKEAAAKNHVFRAFLWIGRKGFVILQAEN
jgi:hypothetical protein